MIPVSDFKNAFMPLFAEIFGVSESEHGFILDNGQSGLIGTIMNVSAAQASQAPNNNQATLASHTGHVLFLLHLFAAFERGENPVPDWAGSWSVRQVDESAWDGLRQDLRTAYATVAERMQNREEWPAPAVGAAMMLLAHCAYHVGEIRQRLLWIGEGTLA